MNEPYTAGYLVYLAALFVPGLGLAELFRPWREGDGLAERFGVVFGLGLAFEIIVLVVKTSGLHILGVYLDGIDQSTVYFILGAGAFFLLASLVIRRKLSFPVRPSAPDLVVFLTMLFLGVLMLLFFIEYPIFPEFPTGDYSNHVHFVEGLVNGSMTSIPKGILYYGVHLQLATSLVFVGGEPLVTVRSTMAFLVLLSPLMVYLAAKRVFQRSGPSLAAVAIYALTGTIAFVGVFDTGLYANFFGILASLFFLVVYVDTSKNLRSRSSWFVFLMALFLLYFAHYTSVTIFGCILLFPLFQFLRKRPDARRYLVVSAACVAPIGIAFAINRNLLHLLLLFAYQGGGLVVSKTVLPGLLAGVPVLSDLAAEFYSDIGFISLLIFASVAVYYGAVSRKALFILPLVWFLSLIVAAPLNNSAWRWSYEAIVPLTLLAGDGAFTIANRFGGNGGPKGYGKQIRVALVLILILSPSIGVSVTQQVVGDSIALTTSNAQSQQSVYAALYWLKNNTGVNSSYLSVSDWRFTYSRLFFGRLTNYSFASFPNQALSYAHKYDKQYIIVTNTITGNFPHEPPSFFPWNNFPTVSNLNLTVVYTDPDVRIYSVR